MTYLERIADLRDAVDARLNALLDAINADEDARRALVAERDTLRTFRNAAMVALEPHLARPDGVTDIDYLRLVLSKIPPVPPVTPPVAAMIDVSDEAGFARHCDKPGTIRLVAPVTLTRGYNLAASIKGGVILFPPEFSGNLLRPVGGKVVIEGVRFDTTTGAPAKPGMNAIKPASVTGLVVRKCQFDHVGSACMFDENPTDYAVVGNTCPGDKSIRRYFVYFGGSDGVIEGNDVANSQYETCIRGRGSRVMIRQNKLRNVKAGTGGPDDDSKEGCIAVQDSVDCVVQDNTCVGDMDLGANPPDEGGKPGDLARRLIVRGNKVSGRSRLRLIDAMTFEDNQVARPVELHPTVTASLVRHGGTIRLHDGSRWYDWFPGAAKGVGRGTIINP